ncbi:hypothetical protein L6164_014209 [Bauhinia variegata]|uniref:Uncharacterized protein n=1 Tax=Bauhinia variegata TaxID=167791 RepID=A0ACB9NGS9_BAUVA|nr:hypothetical protein L6164_014209 [Bauhinia variegata]
MQLPHQSRHFFRELLEYTQQKNLRTGRCLHAQIIKSGSFSCIYLANSLVNFYAKCGHLVKAKIVFDNISVKDVVSWNCLINGFSQQGPSGSNFVMELFRRMRAENTFPNGHTFAGVFTAASNLLDINGGRQAHTLAIKTGSFYDVFVGSSLLNMYCKTGFVFEARKLFERMPERNPVSWATIISGYATQEQAKEALDIFESMRRETEGENEFVYTSVLSALTIRELVDTGKQIHSLAIKTGLLSIISVGNALVTMYAKCGNLDDALQTFDLSGNKNSITWSAMITGYAQSGDSLKALKLFYRMHLSGLVPSEFTLVGVINACSDLGAIIEGKQMHGYSLKAGYELHMYILTALVDMYAKCGSIADAPACKNYRNYDLGAYAGEKLIELGSPESSTYVLLSSIYSALGKLDDVERVRRMMKVRGVSKEPGCSWIELKSLVHVFVVGDQMHPQIDEIKTELRLLTKLMKDEGYRPLSDSLSVTTRYYLRVQEDEEGTEDLQIGVSGDPVELSNHKAGIPEDNEAGSAVVEEYFDGDDIENLT